MAHDLVDLTLMVHYETEKAFLLSDTGIKDDAEWVPKSQCEQGERVGAGTYTFTMPEGIAMDRGFI